jgi:hypothetical protein
MGGKRISGKQEPKRHRVRKVVIDLPCPWTGQELADIVERAIRFIAEAKERLGRRFGWEVGRYLYEEVYRCDDAYIEWRNPNKDDSVRDIARGSGVPYGTLYNYLRAYMTRKRLEDAGLSSELGIQHMKEIAELGSVDHMVAVARWAEANGISGRALHGILDEWKDRIEKGGRIEDLIRKHEKRKGRGKGPRARAPELVVPRLIDLAERWARGARMSEERREELRRIALGIRRRIER